RAASTQQEGDFRAAELLLRRASPRADDRGTKRQRRYARDARSPFVCKYLQLGEIQLPGSQQSVRDSRRLSFWRRLYARTGASLPAGWVLAKGRLRRHGILRRSFEPCR